ncbi:hypothetical protein KO317_03970 [Candidatus Micrarchaeota archaeon]|jgi:hypothetical protein|nr:hypothetical protein [Candidatus Micrarchaeota archaeon]
MGERSQKPKFEIEPELVRQAKALFLEFNKCRSKFIDITNTISDLQGRSDEEKMNAFINIINRHSILEYKKNSNAPCYEEYRVFFKKYVYQSNEDLFLYGSKINDFNTAIGYLGSGLKYLNDLLDKLKQNPRVLIEHPEIFNIEETKKLDQITKQLLSSNSFGNPVSSEKIGSTEIQDENILKKYSQLLNIFKYMYKLCLKYNSDGFKSYECFINSFCTEKQSLISKNIFKSIKDDVLNDTFEWYKTQEARTIDSKKLEEMISFFNNSIILFEKKIQKQKNDMQKPDSKNPIRIQPQIQTPENKVWKDLLAAITYRILPKMGEFSNLSNHEVRVVLINELGDPKIINENDILLMLELKNDNYNWDTLKDKGSYFNREDCLFFNSTKQLPVILISVDSLMHRITNYNSRKNNADKTSSGSYE